MKRRFGGVGIAVVVFLIASMGAIRVGAQGPAPRPALVVVSKGENALVIVDVGSMKAVGKVAVGTMPHEVAVSADGKIALVTNYGPHQDGTSLSVIDLDALREIHRVDLTNLAGPQGENFGSLVGPHGAQFFDGKFYFTAEGSKKIARYDPAANHVDWVQEIGQNRTHMLVISKKTHTIYTSNVNSDSVTAVEPSRDGGHWTNTLIPVGKGPEGIDVSPDGKEVWAANSGDGTVSIIDTSAKKVITTLDVGTKRSNRLKFTLDGKRVLISDIGTGDLLVVDVDTRKIVERMHLGSSAEGIFMQPDGTRAYVAESRDNKLMLVDLTTLAVTGEIDGIRDVDGMAWRGK
jgi:YVTN family beta-propeller protein